MKIRKLGKIRGELLAIRQRPHGHKAAELITLAKKLGRSKFIRGKEPTYVRENEDPRFPFPLTIPNHPGDMKPGTVKSIVETLLADADVWEEWLGSNE